VVMQTPVTIPGCRCLAIKLNFIFILWPYNTPGIAILQPHIGLFNLPSVFNILVKYAVVVTDTVADSGHTEGGHGIKKAGRQAPQSAVTKPRIYFRLTQLGIIQAK